MDYSQLSDFEINKRVFKVLTGAKPLGYPHNADGRSVGNESNGHYCWYDYCNNPADAWPIIVDSKINIRFGAEGMACEAQFMQYGYESVECYHANPLRAAMIVFLMMQGAKHA
ncbi:phage protein NinX family protein [Enterobacter hormaechei subsp. steigerwaltii]|uniref:phage protein NinX family protein n=1 Tax=Enterobacter hormaechei TaxID=158836 RepID=UPI003F42E310